MPMLKTRNRLSVFHRTVKTEPQKKYYLASPQELLVKNPMTGQNEKRTTVLEREEPEIDKFLRVHDFDLEVQLQNEQSLKDCGYYLQPSTPEAYVDTVSHLSSELRGLISKQQQQQVQVPEVKQEVQSSNQE